MEGGGRMATRAIPREQWVGFFDRFSTDHEGQSATLEAIGGEVGDETVAEELYFHGISADLKDGENRIAIQIGPAVDNGTTHTIGEPAGVWLKDGTDGEETSLEIRSADGTALLLRFVRPELPTKQPAS